MSIRNKILFWFLLPSVLITAVTVVFYYFHSQKTVKQNIFDQLEIAANELQGLVHIFLKERKDRITDFSSDGFIRENTEEITGKKRRRKYYTTALSNHLITNKKPLDSSILEIFVIDLTGEVIASTNKDHIGQDVSNEKYYTETELLSAFVRGPQYDSQLNVFVIDFSTMILSKVGQEPIGIIVKRIMFEQQDDRSQSAMDSEEYNRNYSMLVAVNKARVIAFSSDGFIRDCTEEVTRREDRVQYYTGRLNTHFSKSKTPLDPGILATFIVDLTGRIISSSETGVIGKDVSRELYFSETMKKGSYIGDLYHPRGLEHNVFEVARLLLSKDNEGIIGIIVNRYNGGTLNEVTRSGITKLAKGKQMGGLGKTGEVYIVNKNKIMISESRFIEEAVLKQVVDTEGVRKALDNGVGITGVYPDYRGVPIIGVSRYIEEMNWVVLAEKDVAEAFAPLVHLRNFTIIMGVVGIIVVVTIAVFIALSITKPLIRLLEGTRKISEGNLDYRIETRKRDEIGQLVVSFNMMTKELQEKTVSKNYMDNIIKNITNPLIIVDANGKIKIINQETLCILGYERDELIGKPLNTIFDKEMFKKEGIADSINNGLIKNEETFLLAKNGAKIPVLFSSTVLHDYDDKTQGIVCIAQDITERKIAESKIKEAMDAAQQASEAKSIFLSSMSHELRTPMNSILGYAQLLEFNHAEPLTQAQKNKVTQILKSGNHLVVLINEILDLSRIESGRLEVSIEDVDVAFAIKEVITTIAPIAQKHKINVINLIDSESVPYIRANNTRLKQVFINLLSNAIKYNNVNGSVTISCEYPKEDMIRVNIEDTGPGIEEEKFEFIFGPFNRLGTEELGIDGTGIGLTITKKLVGLMGGNIGVKSKVGKGTKFYVDFDKAKGFELETNKTESVLDVQYNHEITEKKTMLYVEDNTDNLKLVECILRGRPNIELLTVQQAQLGIDFARARHPDLILMDINLPGMNGFEALKILRSHDETKDIPAIAISASVMPQDIEKARDAGFKDYIMKPIDINKFLQVIDNVLWNREKTIP